MGGRGEVRHFIFLWKVFQSRQNPRNNITSVLSRPLSHRQGGGEISCENKIRFYIYKYSAVVIIE